MAGVDKRILRREFLRRRKLMATDEVHDRSLSIGAHLMTFIQDQPRLETFHSFLPIERNREVRTWPIIHQLVTFNKVVLISSTNFEDQSMAHFYYEQDLEFKVDPLGIPTPINGRSAPLEDCQCILMPLVVADKKGGRIGYGGGYYDRLLEDAGDVLKVGLSLGPLLDEITVLEPHDVTLDYCITPTETIDCKHG